MPKNPVTRDHLDHAGRFLLKVGTAIARFIAAVARFGARLVQRLIRAVDSVPPTLRVLAGVAVLMLFGIVGAIAWQNTAGLLCTVVVVPVCAITLGALGYRWFSGLGGRSSQQSVTVSASESDLQRSIEYVDKKLTLALGAFGAERNQSAMVALFQAKTAIELTLGTDSTATSIETLFAADENTARPRIRVGSKTALRDSNTLVAS